MAQQQQPTVLCRQGASARARWWPSVRVPLPVGVHQRRVGIAGRRGPPVERLQPDEPARRPLARGEDRSVGHDGDRASHGLQPLACVGRRPAVPHDQPLEDYGVGSQTTRRGRGAPLAPLPGPQIHDLPLHHDLQVGGDSAAAAVGSQHAVVVSRQVRQHQRQQLLLVLPGQAPAGCHSRDDAGHRRGVAFEPRPGIAGKQISIVGGRGQRSPLGGERPCASQNAGGARTEQTAGPAARMTGEPMDAESSLELIERARAGDRDALEALLARYRPRLRRWASGRLPRYARDVTDTDDLVQDVLIGTVRNFGVFEHRGEWALQAYLRQAVSNRIRDQIRRAARTPAIDGLSDSSPTPDASPLESAVGAETFRRYDAALARLDADEREAVIARIELGCSYQEIMALVDKPSADAARMMVSRALARLAQMMA